MKYCKNQASLYIAGGALGSYGATGLSSAGKYVSYVWFNFRCLVLSWSLATFKYICINKQNTANVMIKEIAAKAYDQDRELYWGYWIHRESELSTPNAIKANSKHKPENKSSITKHDKREKIIGTHDKMNLY